MDQGKKSVPTAEPDGRLGLYSLSLRAPFAAFALFAVQLCSCVLGRHDAERELRAPMAVTASEPDTATVSGSGTVTATESDTASATDSETASAAALVTHCAGDEIPPLASLGRNDKLEVSVGMTGCGRYSPPVIPTEGAKRPSGGISPNQYHHPTNFLLSSMPQEFGGHQPITRKGLSSP